VAAVADIHDDRQEAFLKSFHRTIAAHRALKSNPELLEVHTDFYLKKTGKGLHVAGAAQSGSSAVGNHFGIFVGALLARADDEQLKAWLNKAINLKILGGASRLVPCSCRARAVLVSCSCRVRVVLVPCSCRARTVLVPCWCRARTVLAPCSCRARVSTRGAMAAVTVTVFQCGCACSVSEDVSTLCCSRAMFAVHSGDSHPSR
jgi:hypothetical protein